MHFYLNEIKSNHFGVNNFYKTTVDFDYLYKITPEAEKKQLLEFTMKNVNEKFSGIKRKEDHLIFSEKLEKYRVLALPVEPKKSTCVTRFVSSLKGLLGRDQ